MKLALIFIICICVILFSSVYSSSRKQYDAREMFRVGTGDNDSLLSYYDYISLPAATYGATLGDPDPSNASYFIELHDRYFEDILLKCRSRPTEKENTIIEQLLQDDTKKYIRKEPEELEMKEKIGDLVSKCLNAGLDSSDTFLFSATGVAIKEIKRDTEANAYVVVSKCVVHRVGKAYGAVLLVTSYHSGDRNMLIDHKILGFAFEDAATGDVLPANVLSNDRVAYEEDMTILKGVDYEKKALCKYLKDLKRFRNMDYTSLSGENITCDGTSS